MSSEEQAGLIARPRPDGLRFAPKYRERADPRIYSEQQSEQKEAARDRLLAERLSSLGFSRAFLRLHFVVLYAVQALAQMFVVIWSAVRYGFNRHNPSPGDDLWVSAVATIDVIITVLLVVDLIAHLADNAKVYWADWGNRFDACIVGVCVGSLILLMISPTLEAEEAAEEADSISFAFLIISDIVRLLRIAIFVRRIKNAFVWSKESLGYASSEGPNGEKKTVCVVFPDLSNQCSNLIGDEPQAFFAVFEGRAGIEAADYAAKHLHHHMTQSSMFATSPEHAMKASFHSISEDVTRLPGGMTTSATCALVRERELFLVWVGDSRAVLSDGGKAVNLTLEQQPVYLGLLHSGGAQPCYHHRQISATDQFALIGSQGLWSVIEPQQAVDLVIEFLAVFCDSRAASEELMDEAIRRQKGERTSDVSVIIVWYQEQEQQKSQGKGQRHRE
jgi:serine/threonine protein phosphatase PrpC